MFEGFLSLYVGLEVNDRPPFLILKGQIEYAFRQGSIRVPPEDLGPKGDLNDWLRVGAKGDPAVFRSLLERALATSLTPWALQIERLPPDLAPWDLEDHAGVRDLLCELGHQRPLSRDAHLLLLAEQCGVALATLLERRDCAGIAPR